jgi:hypothetical protein
MRYARPKGGLFSDVLNPALGGAAEVRKRIFMVITCLYTLTIVTAEGYFRAINIQLSIMVYREKYLARSVRISGSVYMYA